MSFPVRRTSHLFTVHSRTNNLNMNQHHHQLAFIQSILVMLFQEAYRTFCSILDRAAEDMTATTVLLERPGATMSSMLATEAYLANIRGFIKKKKPLKGN